MNTFRWAFAKLVIRALVARNAAAQTSPYNGLDLGMGNLSRLSHAKTRSISPENLTGEKGKGGRKVNKLVPEPKASPKRNQHLLTFWQANQAGASSDWQSSSSVFVGQAGEKPRAVQHLARDAER
jgi:hypothetical protein